MKSEGKIYWIGVTTAIVVYILGVSGGIAQNEEQTSSQSQPSAQLLELLENPLSKGFFLGGIGAFLTLSATYFPHFKSSAGGMGDLRKTSKSHKCLFVFCGAITGAVTVFIAKKLILSFVAGVSWPAVVTAYQGLSGVVIKATKLYVESIGTTAQTGSIANPAEGDSTENNEETGKDEKDEKAEDRPTSPAFRDGKESHNRVDRGKEGVECCA